MPSAKVAITVDQQLLKIVDRWVAEGRFPNRSQAVQTALREKLDRWTRVRLADELTKLDKKEERRLADEGLGGGEWPAY